MTSSIAARVRRVLRGHSDRALVHAVDDAGLEYKVEVPLEAVREVRPDQDYILVLSWSLQASSRATEPAATSTATSRSSTPSEVDQAFMELMAGPRGSTPVTTASTATSPTSGSTAMRDASHGLAELLGIKHT